MESLVVEFVTEFHVHAVKGSSHLVWNIMQDSCVLKLVAVTSHMTICLVQLTQCHVTHMCPFW